MAAAEDNKEEFSIVVSLLLLLLLLLLQQLDEDIEGIQQESVFPTKTIFPYFSLIFAFISILIL